MKSKASRQNLHARNRKNNLKRRSTNRLEHLEERHLLAADVVVVDSAVDDQSVLLSEIQTDDFEIVYVDSSSDGLTQLADYLNGHRDIEAIHILSHGDFGEFTLGDTTYSSTNIAGFSSQLAQIGDSLTASGDILLYGCNVATNDGGLA